MTRYWHWGIGITLVYATFATATIGFVAFAMQQQVDLVSADYYPQSLAHDARMAATARAAALGDAFSVTLEPGARHIVIEWPAGMRIDAGQITLYRASDAAADRTITVSPDPRGRQTLALDDLPRGVWGVRVDWMGAADAFFAERRVMLP